MPRLIDGTELLGPFHGSGFRDDRYLVRRADGQTILMSSLLYLVTTQIDGRRDVEAVAQAVSVASGRRLTVPHLSLLLANKLVPLGVASFGGAPNSQPSRRPDPGARWSMRPRAAPRRAGLGQHLRPAVLHRRCVRLARRLCRGRGVDVRQPRHGCRVARCMFLERGYLLAFLGLLFASMLFHELGHAAACRYGGGRPGAIGAGLYLMLPAFYTNVTDAYRLPRRRPGRTDLGGIYFNAVFIVVLGGVLPRHEPRCSSP